MNYPDCVAHAIGQTYLLNDRDFAELLIKEGFLSPGPFCCTQCGLVMNLNSSNNTTDGCAWKCPNNRCRRSISIRTNSMFYGCGFSLKAIYVIYACFAANFRPIDIVQVVGVKDLHGVNRLLSLFRARAVQKYQTDITQHPLGQFNTVQMDESALGKAKHHKGRALKRDCNWVVGAFEEHTNRVAVQNVSNRTSATLMNFVHQNIVPGAQIYTDQWPAYNSLTANGYVHKTVNHSIQFVNVLPSGERVNTEKAESGWGSMKKFLDHHSAYHRKYTNEYIQTWAYRKNLVHSYHDAFQTIL